VPHRRLAQAAGLAFIALALCLCVPRAASAAPSISQARSHAARLQAEIAALNDRMAAVAVRYDVTAQRLNVADARITDNQRRLAAAQYQLAVARHILAERVVAMYKAPASGFLDVALTSSSFDDLVDRVHLWNDVYEQGTVAVAAVKRAKAQVEQRGRRLAGDRKRAGELLAQVGVERSEIAGEVRRGQSLLAAAQARVQLLVKQAKARRAAAAAAARAAAAAAAAARAAGYHPVNGAGDAYSPLSWARALLGYLGMPVTSQNLTAITSWELAEGGNWFNSARYNPLDTTMPEPGATVMNSVGVKAYTSWAEGFTATVATLRNGLYGPILAALREGDDALAVAAAVASSPWGTGAFGV
jgi:peptidoglycan hydrolase CwlO-like protein